MRLPFRRSAPLAMLCSTSVGLGCRDWVTGVTWPERTVGVAVAPSDLRVGDSAEVGAWVLDAEGRVLQSARVRLAVSDTTVARLVDTRLLALRAGRVVVRAESDGAAALDTAYIR